MRRARLTCLSCGAVLSDVQPFCDEECERFTKAHGYARHAPHRDRGFPESNRVRKDYRWSA